MTEREHVGFDWSKVGDTTPRDAAVRFGFGAGVSLGAALAGARFGALAGGLFLAFPAILPATLTLVEEHESTRQARRDCRGAAAGVPGLAAFALVVILVPDSPWISLPLATAAWLVTAVVSYLLWRRVREAFGLDERPLSDRHHHPPHRPPREVGTGFT
ncbi:MAG: DUF3147 family protein [Acidimicrobiales bacterium]